MNNSRDGAFRRAKVRTPHRVCVLPYVEKGELPAQDRRQQQQSTAEKKRESSATCATFTDISPAGRSVRVLQTHLPLLSACRPKEQHYILNPPLGGEEKRTLLHTHPLHPDIDESSHRSLSFAHTLTERRYSGELVSPRALRVFSLYK